jgi:plasmid rolling circle replication initiator protein Rep
MINKKLNEIEQEISEKFHWRVVDTEKLGESYERLGYSKRSIRVQQCGTELDFFIPNAPDVPQKLYRANFCKDRLCPMCSWRRSKKIFGQISKIMDKLEPNYQFVFVTLTVQNCAAEELPKAIKELLEAFKLLWLYKDIKQGFKGYFRALEITRHPNRIKSIEYHPHIHAIFAVKPSYFTSRYYISHSKLMSLWKKAVGTYYNPAVRIEKITPKEDTHKPRESTLKGAVCEVAKYSVKSNDYLDGDTNDVDSGVLTLIRSITAHRLCGLGGVFRTAARELKLDDMTEGDLVNTDNEKIRTDLGGMIAHYSWQIGWGYERTSLQEFKREDPHDDTL